MHETLALAESKIAWIAAIERGLIVDADPDQLLRILLNLARNAVQALETRAPNDPARDQVRITGRREGAVVVIEVSDTGPGIPAAVARASVRGVPDVGAQRRNGPRPRHRRRTRPRPRRRDQARRRHHRRDLPPHHSGPGGRARRPSQRAGEGVSMILKSILVSGLLCIGVAGPIAGERAVADSADPHSPRPDPPELPDLSQGRRQPAAVQGQADFGQRRLPLGLYARNGDALRGRHLPAARFPAPTASSRRRDWASAAEAGLRLPSALAKRGMKPIAMPRSAPLRAGFPLRNGRRP